MSDVPPLVVGFSQVAGADRLAGARIGADALRRLLPDLHHLLLLLRFLSPLFDLICISDLPDFLPGG